MSQPYIGEIRLFPYNFAPRDWIDCDGRLLPISQYDALFALIGTTYGGDGQSTFALPDLRGRLPIHQGTGPGLSNRVLGERAGTETVTLTQAQMPAHTHTAVATTGIANAGAPGPTVLPGAVTNQTQYVSDLTGAVPFAMSPQAVSVAGSSQPHDNNMPTLTLRYCMAVFGIFPSQA
ncbi:phage tail protein [Arenimonas sp.]|uniref:phage tail protein n=1 Tax=Arenimonas sp. TaxID=1872635 RepID=UPI002E2F78E9|nr:tail fiber protein [Arenimonas sp.]HEX4853078.1 tail fiber protein [Arenimonas sp.]